MLDEKLVDFVVLKGLVCRHIFCPRCNGAMDQGKSVRVEVKEKDGEKNRTHFLFCSKCFDKDCKEHGLIEKLDLAFPGLAVVVTDGRSITAAEWKAVDRFAR